MWTGGRQGNPPVKKRQDRAEEAAECKEAAGSTGMATPPGERVVPLDAETALSPQGPGGQGHAEQRKGVQTPGLLSALWKSQVAGSVPCVNQNCRQDTLSVGDPRVDEMGHLAAGPEHGSARSCE